LGLHPDKTRVVDLREGREGFVALANIVDTPHRSPGRVLISLSAIMKFPRCEGLTIS
jgi:hypothetical protein